MTVNFEEIAFKIIGKTGEAKYLLMEAFDNAMKNDIDKAEELIENAEKSLNEAAQTHMDVIVEEAQGVQHKFSVVFMHAEDQFLTTQTFALTVKMLVRLLKEKING